MDPIDPLAESSRKEPEKTHWLSRKRQNDQVGKDNKAKGWFLTYPRCPIPKEQVLKLLEKHGIEEYVICHELHKEEFDEKGNKLIPDHIHAFIKLKTRVRFKENRFDLEDLGVKYHGNYQVAKSWQAVIDYVKKDDDYITNINVKAAEQKQSKKIGIAELERDAMDLLEEGIISGFQLANFVKNQELYRMLKQRKQAKQYDLNVEKKRHHWIFGASNTGKTYRLRTEINKNPKNWFQIPRNDDWKAYNGEENLYMDEYKGQLTVQELNRICDGGAQMNTKGGSTVLHPTCTVWICSNYSIEKCYNKVEKDILESIYNRFNEEEMFDIWENGKKIWEK